MGRADHYPYRDTLAFSENLLGLAFFVAPVYWISHNPLLTYNVAFVLSFAFAGTAMYLLVRALTHSRAAAAVGGAFFAFCPFRMAQIAHIQMVATGWIPLGLWALHLYFFTRRRRWLAVFAAGWILQMLSNSYAGYFMAVPVVMVIADGWLRERVDRRRAAVETAVACLVVIAVLAPVGAAYYRVRSSYGQVRVAAEISAGGADVRSYLVGKNAIGIWRWLPTAVITDPEKELFPGVIPLLLAAVGALGARRGRNEPVGRWIRLYAAIALAGFVLSLGPHVRIWGHLLTEHGPYDWLLRVVPGMDGMRVPARFAIIFSVALSVLAGCGVSVALGLVQRRLRPVALAVCLTAVVAEGWAVPLSVEKYDARARPEDRAVAQWLDHRPPGAVLHLPLHTDNWVELNYQYATLLHGHPLVNGVSGYSTPLHDFLGSSSSPLLDDERFPAAVRMLRSLGVRYVILHPNDYSAPAQSDHGADRTIGELRDSGQVVREQRVMGVTMFELEPWQENPAFRGTVVPIDARDFTPSVSEASERLPYLFDGDPDSRWIGGQNPSRPAADLWLAARFSRAFDVARVELQIAERSMSDFPRELEIDGIDPHGRSRVLYRATPYPELAWAIVRDGRYPNIAITLPPNDSLTITIRETAHTRAWWSVHELRLWRRAELSRPNGGT